MSTFVCSRCKGLTLIPHPDADEIGPVAIACPACEERALYRQLLLTWAEALEQHDTHITGFDEDRIAQGLRKVASLLMGQESMGQE